MKTLTLVLNGIIGAGLAWDTNAWGAGGPESNRAVQTGLAPHPLGATRPDACEAFGKLPLMFEANGGRTDSVGGYISHGQGNSLIISATAAEMTFNKPGATRTEEPASTVLRMELSGADPAARITGEDELRTRVNYFTGSDPAKWRTNIATFARVKCQQVYPGVDMVYYGNQHQLEYDFIVAPGGGPDSIGLKFTGATGLRVDGNGDLVISTAGGEIRQRKPFIYQEARDTKREIPGAYRITESGQVRFDVGEYDASRTLVIDPVLSWSTYFVARTVRAIAVDAAGNSYITGQTLGNPNDAFVAMLNASGSALIYRTTFGGNNETDEGFDVAVDAAGNAYVVGWTPVTNFPTVNAYQSTRKGPRDLFVSKLNPNGSALLYSTYLGGSGSEATSSGSVDIAVDASGNVFVAGGTDSGDFPTTGDAFQMSAPAQGFLTKLDTNLSGAASLVYSTRLDVYVEDVTVDAAGKVYVVGSGARFPTTEKAVQRAAKTDDFGFASDVLIVKLDTNPASCTPEPGTNINCRESLLYSTYLGGRDNPNGSHDTGAGIAVDASGFIYVAGTTGSLDFPTTAGAFQAASRGLGSNQAFVVKLDPNPPTCTPDAGKGLDCKEGLVYSTYLGGTGNGDEGQGIALDTAGNIYVTGATRSADFPVKAPFQLYKDNDAFVAKLNPNATGDASLVYSTFLGGSGPEEYMSIAVDSAGDAYVSGTTRAANIFSPDFPTTPGVYLPQSVNGFGVNGFISKVSQSAAAFFASAISPTKGGDSGSVSIAIYGAGFKTGATVKLLRAGQPDIPAENTTIKSDGLIFARFNLAGKEHGLWDIVVTNPGGASTTLPAAFTIEAGRESSGKVEVVGRTNFRPGAAFRVVVTYSNPGNVDILIPLVIRIPEGLTYSLPVPPLHIPIVPGTGPVDLSELPTSYQFPDDPVTPQNEAHTAVPMIVSVPPGHTGSIPVNVRHVNANCTSIQISATAGPPMAPNAGTDCFASLVELAGEILEESLPGGDCVQAAFGLAVKASADVYRGEPSTLSSWIASALLGAALCATDLFPVAKALKIAIKVADLVIGKGGQVVETFNACVSVLTLQPRYAGPGTATLNTSCVSSSDPNDKRGPPGAGTGHHISKDTALPWLILFENKPVATAPAQTVVITDQLDAANVDLSTLSLGLIAFGDKTVIPPPGLQEYTTDVDLRPGNDLIVRIDAKLNVPTGLLTWRFESIDPATGQPTEDPLAGFLPPNVNSPQGDGSVFFTVMPKSGLSHGAEIRNQASIVFDTNAAILTPEWLNTIDDSEPASQVLTLSPLQTAGSFEVTWSGTDTGSGIGSFSIFVSANGGPFTAWLTNTAATSGIFAGQPNTNYAFYSVANDEAGHREIAPAAPDTSTKTPPALSIRREGDDIIVEWTVAGRLQTSDRLAGGFLDVPGAASPHRWRIDTALSKFWRVAR